MTKRRAMFLLKHLNNRPVTPANLFHFYPRFTYISRESTWF